MLLLIITGTVITNGCISEISNAEVETPTIEVSESQPQLHFPRGHQLHVPHTPNDRESAFITIVNESGLNWYFMSVQGSINNPYSPVDR